jgi:MFS family permease
MQTVADLMLINGFGCGVGALSEVIVQMTVADVFFVHERGAMNTIYIWVSGIGASLAPVASGYITLAQGWRWVWWWNVIPFGICILLFVFTYEETKYTYPISLGISPGSHEHLSRISPEPRLQSKKGVAPSETGIRNMVPDSQEDKSYVTPNPNTVAINHAIPQKSYWQLLSFTTKSEGSFNSFARHAYQPVAMLFTIPAVFYMSFVYGVILS